MAYTKPTRSREQRTALGPDRSPQRDCSYLAVQGLHRLADLAIWRDSAAAYLDPLEANRRMESTALGSLVLVCARALGVPLAGGGPWEEMAPPRAWDRVCVWPLLGVGPGLWLCTQWSGRGISLNAPSGRVAPDVLRDPVEVLETRPHLADISLELSSLRHAIPRHAFRVPTARAGSSCNVCLSATHRPASMALRPDVVSPGLGRSGLPTACSGRRGAATFLADFGLPDSRWASRCAAGNRPSHAGQHGLWRRGRCECRCRLLLRLISAALVAGQEVGAYLIRSSGFPQPAMCVSPWDPLVDTPSAYSAAATLYRPRPQREASALETNLAAPLSAPSL